MTPKLPIAVNICVKLLPTVSACFSTDRLTFRTSGESGAAARAIATPAASVRPAPLSTPPRLEIKTPY